MVVEARKTSNMNLGCHSWNFVMRPWRDQADDRHWLRQLDMGDGDHHDDHDDEEDDVDEDESVDDEPDKIIVFLMIRIRGLDRNMKLASTAGHGGW